MSHGDDQATSDTPDDDTLEEELRALVGRIDPVPERVLEGGRGAFTWHTIDEDLAALAQLTHDSLLEDDLALAGVRGPAGPRTITFETPAHTFEVQVTGTGSEKRRLVGQIVPPAAAGIVVEHRTGDDIDASGVADEFGRFVIDAVVAGDVRLRIGLIDGSEVRTEWTQL